MATSFDQDVDFLLKAGLDTTRVTRELKAMERLLGKEYFDKVKQRFKSHNVDVEKSGDSLHRLTQKTKEMERETNRATEAFNRHGQSMASNIANAAKWAAIYFVIYRALRAVTGATSDGVQALEDFDTGMRRTLRLSAAGRGEYGELLKTHIALNAELRNYAYWNGVTYQDLQEISYQLKSAGRDVEQIKDQFQALSEFKMIFPEVDVTRLVKTTTGLVNVFGERGALAEFANEGGKVNRILDMMVSLIAEHKVEAEDIPLFMQYAAQAVKAYGGSLEEVFASQAVFQDNMIKAGIGARGLRQFLDQLAKKYKDIGEVFNIKLDPQQTFYQQMIPFMKALAEKTGDNIEAQSKLAQVFQTRARPMVQLFTADLDRYVKTLEELINSEGARAKSLEVITQSIGYQKTMLANVWKELTSDVLGGDAWLEILETTVGLVRSIHRGILYLKHDTLDFYYGVKEIVVEIAKIADFFAPIPGMTNLLTAPFKAAGGIASSAFGATGDIDEWVEKLKGVDYETFRESMAPTMWGVVHNEDQIRNWFNYVKRLGELREQDVNGLKDYTEKVKRQLVEMGTVSETFLDEAFERQKRIIERQAEYRMMAVEGVSRSDIAAKLLVDLQAELEITEDAKERKKLQLDILKAEKNISLEMAKEAITGEKLGKTAKEREQATAEAVKAKIKEVKLQDEIARRQIDYQGQYKMMSLLGEKESDIAGERLKNLKTELELTDNADKRRDIELDILRIKQSVTLAIKAEELAAQKLLEQRRQELKDAFLESRNERFQSLGSTEVEILEGMIRHIKYYDRTAAINEGDTEKVAEIDHQILLLQQKIAFASLAREDSAKAITREAQKQNQLLSVNLKYQNLGLSGMKESEVLAEKLKSQEVALTNLPGAPSSRMGALTEKELQTLKERQALELTIATTRGAMAAAVIKESIAESSIVRSMREQVNAQRLKNEGWDEEYITQQQISKLRDYIAKEQRASTGEEEEIHQANVRLAEKDLVSLTNKLDILAETRKSRESDLVMYRQENGLLVKITMTEKELRDERFKNAEGIMAQVILEERILAIQKKMLVFENTKTKKQLEHNKIYQALAKDLRDNDDQKTAANIDQNKLLVDRLNAATREHRYNIMSIGFFDEEIIARQKIADITDQIADNKLKQIGYDDLLIEKYDEQNRLIAIQLERRAKVASDIAGGLTGFYMSNIKGEYADSTEAGRAFAGAVTDVLGGWTEQYLKDTLEKVFFGMPMMEKTGEVIYGAHTRGAAVIKQAITDGLSGGALTSPSGDLSELSDSMLKAHTSGAGLFLNAHKSGAQYLEQVLIQAFNKAGLGDISDRASALGVEKKKGDIDIMPSSAGATNMPVTTPSPSTTTPGAGFSFSKKDMAMMGISMATPVASWAAQGGGDSGAMMGQMLGAGAGMFGSMGASALMAGGSFPGSWPMVAAALVASMVLPTIFGKSGSSSTSYEETIYQNTTAIEHLSEQSEMLSRNMMGLRQTLEAYPFQESYYLSASRNTRAIGDAGVNVNVYVDGVEQQGNVSFAVDGMSGYQG